MMVATNPVRLDIQFMRGIAVLSVLLYHGRVIPLSGGYLGVDVFFVISGYLITGIILKGIDAGKFSFAEFYVRRARRLLPAAYSTLLATTVLGAAFLTSSDWQDYLYQLIGTVTFTANLVLPFQTEYFDGAAEGKLLLHTWSLSLEEQYYLAMPLLLVIAPARWRGRLLVAGVLLSLALCVVLVSYSYTYWRLPGIDSRSVAFYSLPTRAWELLAGSLVAWLAMARAAPAVPGRLKLFALLAILVAITLPLDNAHPRFDAIFVVIATALILCGGSDWLKPGVITRTVARVGDWSYSLYLVHWPLFSLAYHAYLGQVPLAVRLGLTGLALLLAWAQYEFVEQRFRYRWRVGLAGAFHWLLAASFVVVMVPGLAMYGRYLRQGGPEPDFAYLTEHAVYLHVGCSAGKVMERPELCRTTSQPLFAVWGDSFSMHLIPGLWMDSRFRDSMIQITKSACAPILGIAALDPIHDPKRCVEFNEKAIALIASQESIKYVVMSSAFDGYLVGGELRFHDGQQIITADRTAAVERLAATVQRLQQLGKRPILVSPPPSAGFDVGRCWMRSQSHLPTLGRSGCDIAVQEQRAYQEGIIAGLKEVQARTGVDVAWIDGITCDEKTCRTAVDGLSMYRDHGHLTAPGAQYIVPKLGVVERLLHAGRRQ